MQVAVAACCKSLGQAPLCKFEFIEDEDIDINEYLEYASKLQALGATIDI